MEAVVALLADRKMDPRPLVTHRIPIAEGGRAYELIKGTTPEASLGVVLTYPGCGADGRLALRRIETGTGRAATGDLKVGLVGAGKFAKGVLLPIMKTDKRVRFVGVCSATGKSSRLTADQFGFAYCGTDWKAVVDDPQVNTVVITTRHHLHAQQAIAALRAGKHLFVEKPLCLNAAELDQVVSAYREAGERGPTPLVMVGFNRRFAPMAVDLRAFMEGVAEPLAIHYRVNAGRIPLDHWTQDADQGGGRLVGEMVHFLDWVIWMANDQPTHVHVAAMPNHGIFNDDNVSIGLRFQNGSMAQVLYLANGGRALGKERIEVHGGGRSAVLDDFGSLELADAVKCRRTRARFKRDKGHAAGWKRFADAIESGAGSPIPFDHIETTMRTAFAALQSLRDKREIALG
jgi:predicted dehydrogenase